MAALASSHLRRLSQGLARAFSGTDSRVRPYHARKHARGIHLSYLHVCFRRARFAYLEPGCGVLPLIWRRMPWKTQKKRPTPVHSTNPKRCGVKVERIRYTKRLPLHSLWTFIVALIVLRRRRGPKRYDLLWEGKSLPPPCKAHEPTAAVEFNSAVLARAIRTPITHQPLCGFSEVVVVQISSVLLGKDPAIAHLFPFIGLRPAATPYSHHYITLRVRVPSPIPGLNALKHLANIVTWKGGGRGLLEEELLACSKRDVLCINAK
eukprot:6200922-Pleurochrysis_carterae.AAC.4